MNEDNELPVGWVETTPGQVTAPTSIIVKPDESTKFTYMGMEHVEAETMRLDRLYDGKRARAVCAPPCIVGDHSKMGAGLAVLSLLK